MKKIILMFAVLSSFVKCGGGDPPINSLPPYMLGFQVILEKVKDPEVKYIKVAIKSIDKIVPKYKVRVRLPTYADVHYDQTKDSYFITQQRKAFTVDTDEGSKTYYFANLYINLNYIDYVPYTVNKDRIFELKIYKNDDLFLTKKITFRSNRHPNLKDRWSDDPNDLFFVGYTDKVEVDNMDYVKEINVGDRQGRALIIEIPDKPIKK